MTATLTKDFVEIRPVRLVDGRPQRVFAEASERRARVRIGDDGALEIDRRPDHADGAYINLRHAQARGGLDALGLSCAAGDTHVLDIDGLRDLLANTTGPLGHALVAAMMAGGRAGATHVEIHIS